MTSHEQLREAIAETEIPDGGKVQEFVDPEDIDAITDTVMRFIGLDTKAVDHALRRVIEYADYDLHKGIECDEETEKDTYPSHVTRFVAEYNKAVGNG